MATIDSDSNGVTPLKLVNVLSESRSPYVRGHMNNPVAWQTWKPESLAKAKTYNRLLFVSIGYAACHWCHVMERESFLSPEVADLLNDHFIPIKIDREERPDIDAIYMNYVQATTGSGGWPLNVFLTPDLQPVFGGTYWPGPSSSTTAITTGDTVGFVEILEKLRDVWRMQESKCKTTAQQITQQLKEFAEEGVHSQRMGERGESEGLEIELLEEAYVHFKNKYDKTNAGFATAPKFPTPVNLSFLLRLGQWPDVVKDIVGEEECANAAAMVINTLQKMARSGIRDQIGYGFARYSVTADWSLPHFEKMLYDQAQLLDVYLDAYLITHDLEMLGAVYDIAAYLTSPPVAATDGGFYSAEDADSYPTNNDSEKREGAYYVWTLRDFRAILGDQAGDVCARYYGLDSDGNVARENDPHDELMRQNVLSIKATPKALAQEFGLIEQDVIKMLYDGRRKLREHREQYRPRPALDDKIVAGWNGLAIGALARTSAVLAAIDSKKSKECRAAAENAAAFIRRELLDEDTGKLWRLYREGRGDAPGFADDYAFLIKGLVDLYEATFDDQYLQFADTLQAYQIVNFSSQTGAFYTTPNPSSLPSSIPSQQSDLLLRLKSGMDSAEPSPNNISASNLHRLSSLLSDDSYAQVAKETVLAFEAEVEQWPFCFAGMLESVVMGTLGLKGVVIAGGQDDDEAVKDVLGRVRASVGAGRTVTRIGHGVKDRWLRERNKLLGEIHIGEGDEVKVMVCEKGVCKEGPELVV